MRQKKAGALLPAFAVLLFTADVATVARAEEPAVSAESLNRFLAGVRNFADGKLTPGPLYDPTAVGLPGGNGALGVIGTPSAPTIFNTNRPASWRAANGKLATAAIARSTIVPQRIVLQRR